MHAGLTPVDRHVRGRRCCPPLLGAVIGYLGFRFGLRGFYFVLLTVAFAEICRIVALNTDAVGGALGLYITFTGNPRQFQFQDNRVYYYVALGAHAGRHRRRGRASSAAASAPTSRRSARTRAPARPSGVNTFRYKMLAMVVSSFLTGVGGTFYAFYLFSLQPNSVFGIPLSVEIIIRPIVGGAGTVLGPILGSFILSPLAEISRIYFGAGRLDGAHLIVYGLLLIAVVLFLPQGAYPRPPPPLAKASADERRAMSALCSKCTRAARKRFGGLQAVADLVARRWREGEMLGLIGPNGAGKTTVVQSALGLPRPRRGRRSASAAARSSGSSPTRSAGLGLARTFQIVRPVPAPLRARQRAGGRARRGIPRWREAREQRARGDRAGRARRQGRARGAGASPWPSASGSSWRARWPPSRRCSCSTR